MRIYFIATKECALKINGNFLGFVDGFERFVWLSARDRPFCELIPTDGNTLPLAFVLDENIADCPPAGTSVYLLPDGIAVVADKFDFKDATLKIIHSKTLTFGNLTVFYQGKTQAWLGKKEKSALLPLSPRFLSCHIQDLGNIVLLEGENELCALDESGTPFFNGAAEGWEYDKERKELQVLVPLRDLYGSKKKLVYSCAEAPVLKERLTLAPTAKRLPQFILCEFLQKLLTDADVQKLLCDELFCDLEQLKSFLGEYVAAFITEKYPFGAGVVCPKGKDVYQVKYYSAEVEDGKICNVTRQA